MHYYSDGTTRFLEKISFFCHFGESIVSFLYYTSYRFFKVVDSQAR